MAMTLKKKHEIKHEAINLPKGEKVRDKVIYIQNINAYHSRLKNWIQKFKVVTTKYLDSYLAWFRAMEETNINYNAELIISRAKSVG